eukprot:422962-Pyramimonas_sp.AAC.1
MVRLRSASWATSPEAGSTRRAGRPRGCSWARGSRDGGQCNQGPARAPDPAGSCEDPLWLTWVSAPLAAARRPRLLADP